ncbi:MAG: hypothetical protein HZC41_07140 [Chloroflexi bacterium]|nr:hypothetical protein [Chloroflexota bacterium]
MRGRERVFATLGIWVAFAVMMNNLLDRFTEVNANFNGLWESGPRVFMGPEMTPEIWEQFNQALDRANAVREQVVADVAAAMSRQLDANMGPLVLLATLLILAAVLSTFFVWRNAHLDAAEPARAVKATGKAKRGAAANRVELVLDTLDETELDELRARLETAESTPASFEELLRQQETERRSRR